MRLRPALPLLFLTATSAAVLVTSAGPSAAAGADRKTYKTTATSSDAVNAPRLGSLELADYLSGTYTDRIIGSAGRRETVTVAVPQDDGSTLTTPCSSASVSFYGKGFDWANVAEPAQGARLLLDCTYPSGEKHRFYWGMVHLGDYQFTDVTNCLQLTRSAGSTATSFTATTDGSCLAQDEVVDNSFRRVSSRTHLRMPLTITFTVAGVVPTA